MGCIKTVLGVLLFCQISSGWVSNRRLDNEFETELGIDGSATRLITSNGSNACTGTFLDAQTVITAVHCIDRTKATGGVNIEGIESIAYLVSDNLPETFPTEISSEESIKTIGLDLAIVFFPEATGDFLGIKKYAKIAKKSPESGDFVTFVGYGLENLGVGPGLSGFGVKGWGQSQVDVAFDGIVITTAGIAREEFKGSETPGNRSAALPGDSGSLVYNGNGEAVAVVHAMSPQPVHRYRLETEDGKALNPNAEIDPSQPLTLVVEVEDIPVINVLVDLNSEASRALLNKAREVQFFRTLASCETPLGTLGSLLQLISVTKCDKTADPFLHQTLFTGKYQAAPESPEVFAVSMYEGPELRRVTLYEIDGNSALNPEFYRCIEGGCVSEQKNVLLLEKSNHFTRITKTQEISEYHFVRN